MLAYIAGNLGTAQMLKILCTNRQNSLKHSDYIDKNILPYQT